MTQILIVDDEKNIREGLADAVELEGYQGIQASDGKEALEILKREKIHVILSDLRMPTLSGHDLLTQVTQLYPAIPLIIITGHGDVQDAVRAMQQGAFDFLTKPLDLSQLFAVLERALKMHTAPTPRSVEAPGTELPVGEETAYETRYSHSPLMRQLLSQIRTLAPSSTAIALASEEGNEIDWVAQTIWFYSSRRERPFFKIDCASLSPSHMEEDLFGLERNNHVKKGRLELAHRGTLFWENLDLLTPLCQNKLLALLKNKGSERMGSPIAVPLDIRFLFHDSEKLKESVGAGTFREDLYGLIHILELAIPPLSERSEDIPFLCDRFLRHLALRSQIPPKRLSPKAQKRLQAYPFKRNVEELDSLLERLFALTTGTLIEEKDLPHEIRFWQDQSPKETITLPIGSSWQELEKIIISRYLKAHKNKTTISRILKISRRTLYRKIKEYDLEQKNRS